MTKIQRWDLLLRSLRAFFHQKGLLEVTTPSLVVCPGTEPTLDIFATDLNSHYQPIKKLYLPTSPEIHLKKLLAMGSGSIFEIKTCFRNGELTQHHQPEFTMLEFYIVNFTWRELMKITEDLIMHLAGVFQRPKPNSVEVYSVADLFLKQTGSVISSDWKYEDYLQLATNLELRVPDKCTIDDLFFLIWLEKIEPTFSHENLIFVHSYPPFQAALAEMGDDGFAKRFEVYWQGLELGNAFEELTNSETQRQRAKLDMTKRAEAGGLVTPLDEEFLNLVQDIPRCSGIAIGVERLMMALFSISDISEVRAFIHKDFK